jgi:hypothetical protein
VDLLEPLLERGGGVVGFAKAEVAPVGGGLEGDFRAVVGVGDTEGGVVAAEDGKNLVVEPTRVANSKAARRGLGSLASARKSRRRGASFFMFGGRPKSRGPRRGPRVWATEMKAAVGSAAFLSRLKCVIVCGALKVN